MQKQPGPVQRSCPLLQAAPHSPSPPYRSSGFGEQSVAQSVAFAGAGVDAWQSFGFPGEKTSHVPDVMFILARALVQLSMCSCTDGAAVGPYHASMNSTMSAVAFLVASHINDDMTHARISAIARVGKSEVPMAR